MEAAVLWKAAMRPRLPTGLGKRRQEAAGVSHSSHSPCYWKRKPGAETKQTTLRLTRLITNSKGGIISWPTGGKVGWPLTPSSLSQRYILGARVRAHRVIRFFLRVPALPLDKSFRRAYIVRYNVEFRKIFGFGGCRRYGMVLDSTRLNLYRRGS